MGLPLALLSAPAVPEVPAVTQIYQLSLTLLQISISKSAPQHRLLSGAASLLQAIPALKALAQISPQQVLGLCGAAHLWGSHQPGLPTIPGPCDVTGTLKKLLAQPVTEAPAIPGEWEEGCSPVCQPVSSLLLFTGPLYLTSHLTLPWASSLRPTCLFPPSLPATSTARLPWHLLSCLNPGE